MNNLRKRYETNLTGLTMGRDIFDGEIRADDYREKKTYQ